MRLHCVHGTEMMHAFPVAERWHRRETILIGLRSGYVNTLCFGFLRSTSAARQPGPSFHLCFWTSPVRAWPGSYLTVGPPLPHESISSSGAFAGRDEWCLFVLTASEYDCLDHVASQLLPGGPALQELILRHYVLSCWRAGCNGDALPLRCGCRHQFPGSNWTQTAPAAPLTLLSGS